MHPLLAPAFYRRPRTDVWFCEDQQRIRYEFNPAARTLTIHQVNKLSAQVYGFGYGPRLGRYLPPLPRDAEPTTAVAFAQAYDRLITNSTSQRGSGPTLHERLEEFELPTSGLGFITCTGWQPLTENQIRELIEAIDTTEPVLPAAPRTLSECSSNAEREIFCWRIWTLFEDRLWQWAEKHYARDGAKIAVVSTHAHEALQTHLHTMARSGNYFSFSAKEAQPSDRAVRIGTQFGTVELLLDRDAQEMRLEIFG